MANDVCGDCNHPCHGPAWNRGTAAMAKQPCRRPGRRKCGCETCACKDCGKWWKEFDAPANDPTEKTFRFAELNREHQGEIVGNLGRKVAQGTVWKLVPDFPVDHAAALADVTAIQIFDDDIESLIEGIKHQGKVTRPILIDELDEEGAWMEGKHRSLASQQMGLKTIPALYRVE